MPFPSHQWRCRVLPRGYRQRRASLEFLRRITRHCSAPRGLPTHIRTSRFLSWGTNSVSPLWRSCIAETRYRLCASRTISADRTCNIFVTHATQVLHASMSACPPPPSHDCAALSPTLPSNPSLPIQRPGLRTRVRCRRTSAPTHVCRRFFCACISVQWRLCVGGFRACRVPVSPVSQPAHSCHPFA